MEQRDVLQNRGMYYRNFLRRKGNGFFYQERKLGHSEWASASLIPIVQLFLRTVTRLSFTKGTQLQDTEPFSPVSDLRVVSVHMPKSPVCMLSFNKARVMLVTSLFVHFSNRNFTVVAGTLGFPCATAKGNALGQQCSYSFLSLSLSKNLFQFVQF